MISNGNGKPVDLHLAKGFVALVRMGIHDPLELAEYLGLRRRMERGGGVVEVPFGEWTRKIKQLDNCRHPQVRLWVDAGIPPGDPFAIHGFVRCPDCRGRISEVPCQFCARQTKATSDIIRHMVGHYRRERAARVSGVSQNSYGAGKLSGLIRDIVSRGLEAIEAGSPDSQEIAHLLRQVVPDILVRPRLEFRGLAPDSVNGRH